MEGLDTMFKVEYDIYLLPFYESNFKIHFAKNKNCQFEMMFGYKISNIDSYFQTKQVKGAIYFLQALCTWRLYLC